MAMYDSRQMNKMRQDAIHRSQEMYRRSMVNSSHYSQGQRQHHEPQPEAEPEPRQKQQASEPEPERLKSPVSEKQHADLLKGLFEGKIDSEKLMIIALMVILIREGADMKLILALGYILL